ncbi:hypothetical protein VTL71DRAFT_7988 [Oculimacula yallundae]|uniref:Leucine-rich repeat domain-containing protein n=1 Tax=Oculimacula yallundae TaxID=86028 RepID=A0ABR4CW98_9HELO
MGVDNLSDELLLEIVKFLKIGGRHADLSCLASCSRRWNRITTPLLYRDVKQSDEHALTSLLYTMLKKPDLAELVQSYAAAEIEDVEPDVLKPLYEHLDKFRRSIESTNAADNQTSRWLARMQQGNWQALTTLLLLNLPNLKELTLGSYNNHSIFEAADPGSLGFVLAMAARQQLSGETSVPSFQNLLKVAVAYADTEMGLGFEEVACFLELPSVKDFHIHMLDGTDFESSTPGKQFHTRKLVVSYSAVEPESLPPFLQCFPDLEYFSYEHAGGIVGCMEFLPQTLGLGIQHLKHNLKTLKVFGSPEAGDGDEPMAVGSLKDFENLAFLHLEQATLLGFDEEEDSDSNAEAVEAVHLWKILPSSLMTLALSSCSLKIFNEFEGLLERKGGVTPKLCDVGFQFLEFSHEPEYGEGFIARAKTGGVDLLLESDSGPSYRIGDFSARYLWY